MGAGVAYGVGYVVNHWGEISNDVGAAADAVGHVTEATGSTIAHGAEAAGHVLGNVASSVGHFISDVL
ncbi:MAG: hypothetical protein JO063_12705 [Pseudonocardiales bacterium]|nr:hypothetical protein [Pseudonocardiales bacterium]